jgi:hypothetical protein
MEKCQCMKDCLVSSRFCGRPQQSFSLSLWSRSGWTIIDKTNTFQRRISLGADVWCCVVSVHCLQPVSLLISSLSHCYFEKYCHLQICVRQSESKVSSCAITSPRSLLNASKEKKHLTLFQTSALGNNQLHVSKSHECLGLSHRSKRIVVIPFCILTVLHDFWICFEVATKCFLLQLRLFLK